MIRPDWMDGDYTRVEPVNPAVAQDRADYLFALDKRGDLVWAMSWSCPVGRCPQVGHGLRPGWCTDHDLRMVQS